MGGGPHAFAFVSIAPCRFLDCLTVCLFARLSIRLGCLPDCLFSDCLTVSSCACLFLCVISSMGSDCLTVYPFVAVRVSVCPDSSLSVGWFL